MGDGPAYDSAYDRRAAAWKEREERQASRYDTLLMMIRKDGFGEYEEGDRIDKDITNHLRAAFDLLSLKMALYGVRAERDRLALRVIQYEQQKEKEL